MKKLYILQYEKNEDDFSTLIVADPDIKLPNGNIKVINIMIGAFVDKIIKELTKEAADNDSE